jgi:hypothetical protein
VKTESHVGDCEAKRWSSGGQVVLEESLKGKSKKLSGKEKDCRKEWISQ